MTTIGLRIDSTDTPIHNGDDNSNFRNLESETEDEEVKMNCIGGCRGGEDSDMDTTENSDNDDDDDDDDDDDENKLSAAGEESLYKGRYDHLWPCVGKIP
jgi:hypothetical protein